MRHAFNYLLAFAAIASAAPVSDSPRVLAEIRRELHAGSSPAEFRWTSTTAGPNSPVIHCQPPSGRENTYTVWREIELNPDDQFTIPPNTPHWFQAGDQGALISKLSLAAPTRKSNASPS